MSYVPNATDVTQPMEYQTVESAALEFRTLKAKTGDIDDLLAQEIAERIDADRNIVDSFSCILDTWVAANFTNFDLGFVIDAVPPCGATFDFGSLH